MRLEEIDERHSWKDVRRNIGLFFGKNIEDIYDQTYVKRYCESNDFFFNTIFHGLRSFSYLVDCSKTPDRLEALLSHSSVEFWCIYLKRDPAALYASRMKRARRRHPLTRYAVTTFLFGWLTALWLKKRWIQRCDRVFAEVPRDRGLEISWEEFGRAPVQTLSRVWSWLGVGNDDVASGERFFVRPANQHVFVGNRWLFGDCTPQIEIVVRDDVDALPLGAGIPMRFVFAGNERARRP
jgi:hypothetical protein